MYSCLPEKSPPSRGRGLKQQHDLDGLVYLRVAPFTGAWIETACAPSATRRRGVAPFTGAWIETTTASTTLGLATGRPLHGDVD